MTDLAQQHPLDWSSPRHARIGLGAQIREVAYELEQRGKVYPRLAQQSQRKASELAYHKDCMVAVGQTLEWLRDREAIVRAAAAQDLESLLRAAAHALRSYQYGNAAPDLAAGMADRLDDFLRAAGIPEGVPPGAPPPEAGGGVGHSAPAGTASEGET